MEYLAKELLPPGLKELPPGFSKGEKTGWEGKGHPPGWERGKKKGWPEGVIPETYIISYSYDGNGNLIKEEKTSEATNLTFTTTYKWDYENKLTMVSSPLAGEGRGGGSVSYAYDGDGNRVSKTDASGTIKYINDVALPLVQVLQETDSAGNLIASYTYGNDLISQTRSGITSYYLYDGLGSTRQLTDSAGSVTDSYIYEGFGNCIYSSGATTNPYLFTGEAFESLPSLYYLRARYYDPSIGRFISRDPILSPMWLWIGRTWAWFVPLVDQPQMLHPYVYVQNNSINLTDPRGLACGPGILGDVFIPDRWWGAYDFTLSCLAHDSCYAGCGKSKSGCDEAFYDNMLNECNRLSRRNPFYYDCLITARTYYLAVKHAGGKSYRDAQAKSGCQPCEK